MTRIRMELSVLIALRSLVAAPFGLPVAAEMPSDLVLQTVDDGYDDPVVVTGSGDGSGRIFVVEQPGGS